MSDSTPSGSNKRPSVVDSLQSTERLLRQAGRDFLVHFYAALRSLKLYLKRRRGITLRAAVRQALFVVGAALRYAAVQHPEQLGPYVERMVTH